MDETLRLLNYIYCVYKTFFCKITLQRFVQTLWSEQAATWTVLANRAVPLTCCVFVSGVIVDWLLAHETRPRIAPIPQAPQTSSWRQIVKAEDSACKHNMGNGNAYLTFITTACCSATLTHTPISVLRMQSCWVLS